MDQTDNKYYVYRCPSASDGEVDSTIIGVIDSSGSMGGGNKKSMLDI